MTDRLILAEVVIDASVAVKWFTPEKDQPKALKILSFVRQRKINLFSPELLIYEVGNALFKGKHFNLQELNEAMTVLSTIPLNLFSLSQQLIGNTINLMVAYDLTFYDASYGALASYLSLPLLTANAKDQAKIKEIKVSDLAKLKI